MHTVPYWRLSGFYFFHFAFIGAFAPYWSLYLKYLSFSALQIGMLMSLLHVTRVFAPAAWGWLADHTGQAAADRPGCRARGSGKLLWRILWRVVWLDVRNHGADELLLERVAAVNRGHHTFLPGRKHGSLWAHTGLGISWIYFRRNRDRVSAGCSGYRFPVVGGAWAQAGYRYFLTPDSRRGSHGSSRRMELR